MATIAADLPVYRELTPGQRVLRRFMRRRGALVGLAVVVFFVLLALFAPWIAPHDPLQASWSAVRKAPSAMYVFGTDEIGRDVASRVIWGTRASLLGGARVGEHRAFAGRADRAARRLRRRMDRRTDLAHHRRDARLPVPDPRDRAGRVSRARASPTR